MMRSLRVSITLAALAVTSVECQTNPIHRKWLDEEVVYVISDDERTAFLSLLNDREKDTFIRDFWDRHGGEKARAAQTRRIAYASEHFASPGLAGWKTDRGRTYIRYGPPDLIEDHSQGGFYERPAAEGGQQNLAYPFQRWTYRDFDGSGKSAVLEFVDKSMTGEFRLAKSLSDKDVSVTVPGVTAFTLGDRPSRAFGGENQDELGKMTVAVDGAVATITIPLVSSSSQVHILGRVMTPTRQPIETFETQVSGQSAYRRVVTLKPGSYRVVVIVKEMDRGQIARRELGFKIE